METSLMVYIGHILGLYGNKYWGYIGNNGKENGNYRNHRAIIIGSLNYILGYTIHDRI